MFRPAIQALEETLAILDMDGFRRAADLIRGARRFEFYGLGGSAQTVRDVAHMLAVSASPPKAGDQVLAFSHSGRTAGVLEAVQIARTMAVGRSKRREQMQVGMHRATGTDPGSQSSILADLAEFRLLPLGMQRRPDWAPAKTVSLCLRQGTRKKPVPRAVEIIFN